jgi:hypothetical protein
MSKKSMEGDRDARDTCAREVKGGKTRRQIKRESTGTMQQQTRRDMTRS